MTFGLSVFQHKIDEFLRTYTIRIRWAAYGEQLVHEARNKKQSNTRLHSQWTSLNWSSLLFDFSSFSFGRDLFILPMVVHEICMKSWPKSLCQRTCRGWKELRICGGTRTNRSKSWKKLTKTEKWEWPMTLVMNHNRPSTFETKSSSLHSSQCYKNYLYSLNIAKVYIQLT